MAQRGRKVTPLDTQAIADAAARAAVELWERKLKAVGTRHYGMKAIRMAVASVTGGPEPSPTTIRAWARTKDFPLDENKIGIFVSQWALERWCGEYQAVMNGTSKAGQLANDHRRSRR